MVTCLPSTLSAPNVLYIAQSFYSLFNKCETNYNRALQRTVMEILHLEPIPDLSPGWVKWVVLVLPLPAKGGQGYNCPH